MTNTQTERFHTLVNSYVGKGYLRSKFNQSLSAVLDQLRQYVGIVAIENADTGEVIPRKEFIERYMETSKND